ncbi:SWF or SNF family helicase [Streptomyces roseoverticillatus]|uniref:SWIM zinc finger family protein n=1 Tax=Streptomyces roseoverticillatus TaxID=66429 RepID=UPI001F25E7CF|nr:SWF or SNF family helicase [Streptomyces roseoverticillatus]MCF3103674.1 SWF or SNF family helicase [Streptomyces roseoverticillatus]
MTGQEAADRAEHTFEALPPEHVRSSARTWWGRAWLKALEDTALDGRQVKAGRSHARAGAVGAVSVRPGRITAVVRDRDGTPYRADVVVQEFGTADWERLLELVAGQAGHIAALLDREIPPHLAEDALAAGVELLPGIGDLEPECSCGAWDHCAHTAALCHQMALLLDRDPFALLLMRGRGERELLDELQERNAASGPDRAPGRSAGTRSGVPAGDVFAAASSARPLPDPPLPVETPGRSPVLGGDVAPAAGLDAGALEFLVAAAAAQARLLLAEALTPGHERAPVARELTLWEDAVRLAAAGPDERIAVRLAAGCGRERSGLDRAVRAWQHGGPASLAVLEEEWTLEPEALARARARLADAWPEEQAPQLRAVRNRWTVVGTGAQLRYGRDGRWWPYRKEGGRWQPAGSCESDPAAALSALLTDTLPLDDQ